MTRFMEAPNSDNFVMETAFPAGVLATVTTLEVVSDLGLTKTDVINQVIGVHKWTSELQSAGGLLLARTDTQLEVMNTPELSAAGKEVSTKRVQILPKYKNYLEPRTDEANPNDLVDFWESAITFYCQLAERRALGQTLLLAQVVDYSAGPFARGSG